MSKLKIIIFIIHLMAISVLPALEVAAEFRSAAFFHSSKKFRSLYGDVGPCYEVEVNAKLCCPLDAFANIDYFHKHKNHGCQSKSTIDLINFSFGLKYVYSFCNDWDFYVGIGPAIGGVYLKNRADAFRQNTSKFIFGGIVKSGFNYTFCNNVFLDIFADYLYQPVRFHNRIDLGGVKLGLGIGYKF